MTDVLLSYDDFVQVEVPRLYDGMELVLTVLGDVPGPWTLALSSTKAGRQRSVAEHEAVYEVTSGNPKFVVPYDKINFVPEANTLHCHFWVPNREGPYRDPELVGYATALRIPATKTSLLEAQEKPEFAFDNTAATFDNTFLTFDSE